MVDITGPYLWQEKCVINKRFPKIKIKKGCILTYKIRTKWTNHVHSLAQFDINKMYFDKRDKQGRLTI